MKLLTENTLPMARIPYENECIADFIFKKFKMADAHLESRKIKQTIPQWVYPDFLEASWLGAICLRQLWYGFRWSSRTPPAKLKGCKDYLFPKQLESIGATVSTADANNIPYRLTALGGHLGSIMDGCAVNIPTRGKKWHVLEFKTVDLDTFLAIKKNGLRAEDYNTYCKLMLLMGMSQGMERALCCIACDSTMGLHFEVVYYNQTEYLSLLTKAEHIIFNDSIPNRIDPTGETDFCKRCVFYSICQQKEMPDVNCRTCAYGEPSRKPEAQWVCHEYSCEISDLKKQNSGCFEYQLSQFFLT